VIELSDAVKQKKPIDGAPFSQYLYLIRRATMGPIERSRTPATERPVKQAAKLSPRDEANNRLFFRLFQTANIYQTMALRELNVSAVQGATLGALSRDVEHGMPFSDLYDYLAVSRQNLDAVLKRLEEAGYVERVEGAADRRRKVVRLTPNGVVAWRDLQTQTVEFFRQGTGGISATEISTCVATLAKIGRALKAARLE
jgi:DNA-binding MarR family transcriptional regulator